MYVHVLYDVVVQAQVNDLIQSQQNGQTSDEETDRQNSSEGTTPKCSPSPSLLQHSQTTKNSSQEERVQTAGQSDVMMEGSNHANQSQQSRSCDGGDNDVSNSFKSSGRSLSAVNRYASGGERNHNSHQSELKDHNQPLSAGLKNSYPPLLLTLGDQSLPPLHPDVLQQQFTAGDISMLPVPRIMYVGHGTAADDGLYRATRGTTFVSQYGGADYTMDENTQMADMIALKYLGKKSGPLSDSNEVPGELHVRYTSKYQFTLMISFIKMYIPGLVYFICTQNSVRVSNVVSAIKRSRSWFQIYLWFNRYINAQ